MTIKISLLLAECDTFALFPPAHTDPYKAMSTHTWKVHSELQSLINEILIKITNINKILITYT